MSCYQELIREAEEQLKDSSSFGEIRLLMLELCREEEIDLYLNINEEASEITKQRFQEGIKRLLQEEPLSYILGYHYFYGYQLFVDHTVLIPRNETEELVGYILAGIDEYFGQTQLTVFDVATGSGAIAIALKAEEPGLTVYASDISSEAIKTAEKNASHNHTEITFLEGNMLDPFIEKGLQCEVLVCNPPYISSGEEIARSVKEYEPHLALFGGTDGLKFYHEVFIKAKKVVKEKAFLAFEIGYQQGEILKEEALKHFPNAKVELLQDLNHLDRMLFVYL